MVRNIIVGLFISGIALVSGCGSDRSSSALPVGVNGANIQNGASPYYQGQWSYEYPCPCQQQNPSYYNQYPQQSSCTTGRHSFSSFNEYCNALINDSINNGYCAYWERRSAYDQQCVY